MYVVYQFYYRQVCCIVNVTKIKTSNKYSDQKVSSESEQETNKAINGRS